MRRTSSAGNDRQTPRRQPPDGVAAGFVLMEIIPALIILGLVILIGFPALPRGTTNAGLTAVMIETATLMRTARTTALASGRPAVTVVDRVGRTIRQGDRILTLPADLDLAVLAAETCQSNGATISVVFRPDGTSCGAVVRIAKGNRAFRVRVNWATGHVSILEGG